MAISAAVVTAGYGVGHCLGDYGKGVLKDLKIWKPRGITLLTRPRFNN